MKGNKVMGDKVAMRATYPLLYKQSYVDKGDERTDLFRKLVHRYFSKDTRKVGAPSLSHKLVSRK